MEEKEVEKKGWTIQLQFIITLLAVFAPLLYLMGLSFYSGLMSAYGISSDVFEMSVQDIYFTGYIAVLQLLINLKDFVSDNLLVWDSLFKLAIFFVTIVSLLLIFIFRARIKEYSWITGILDHFVRTSDFFSPKEPSIGGAITLGGLITFLLVNFVVIFATIFSIWGLPSILGYAAGKSTAEKQITSYLEKGCYFEQDKRWSNCRVLQGRDGQLIYDGILVANSDSRIAFFTKNGAIVAQIPAGAIIINQFNPDLIKLNNLSN